MRIPANMKNGNGLLLIWLILLLTQVLLYFATFSGHLSPNSQVWADFATFFGLSFSFISAIFIFLTYRSQTNMSAVLQFESIFFQWHQQHRELYKTMQPQIAQFSENVVMRFLRGHAGPFTMDNFRNDAEGSLNREVIPYYRSLYQLMKYIHQSTILHDDAQRKKYFDIMQALMSDEELNTVMYLLFADKSLNNQRVLKTCTLLELVDKYHLLKNFYYAQTEPNFDELSAFMNEKLPQTRNSFHFMKKA